MTVAYISHAACRLHQMGNGHPEQPARVSAIEDQLHGRRLYDFLVHHDAPRASVEQLARVHPRDHIERVSMKSPAEGLAFLDPDTAMCPDTLEAALRAAGANVLATDLVLAGTVRRAFCNVRPPGHHAERARAMGFCFFNNVAIAAKYALERHGLQRVAIIDFDVHHGNGTEDVFAGDERVLMVSTFQHPLYPYSGFHDPAPNMVNVPLPEGTGSQEFRDVVRERWLPALLAFQPQVVFVSAGFDAHREDPLAGLRLTDADYAWVTRELCYVANKHAGGRIVSTLEGGYSLSALGRAAAEHVKELIAG